MTLIVAFFIWIGIPAILVAWNFSRLLNLAIERRHSSILYAFCDVRDTFALKAIRNEISEDGEIFKFFYSTNAIIIHNHPTFGKCFVAMIRDIYKKRVLNGDKPTEESKLAIELRDADDESKAAAMKFIHAYTKALLTAMPFIVIDLTSRLIGKTADIFILSILSKNPLSKENRNAAKFGMVIAKAACL